MEPPVQLLKLQAAVDRPWFSHLLSFAISERSTTSTSQLVDETSTLVAQRREVVGVLTVLGRRGTLRRVRSEMISVGVVLMHGRERISGERRPGTGESRLGVLLIPATRSGGLVSQGADLVRELVRSRYVVSSRISAAQAGGVVEVVVLELDERGFPRLGHRGARCRAIPGVAAGSRRTRRDRAETAVMEMLVHVGATVSPGVTTTGLTARRRSATATTRHTVRGRGTRRTGVARPEWAPQVREVERRRAAWPLHLRAELERGLERR